MKPGTSRLGAAEAKRIRACLHDFWDEQMGAGGEGLFPVGSGMDSLTAVTVLLDVEKILDGPRLPLTVIRKGGYTSKEDFIGHVSDNVAAFLNESH